MLGLLGTTLIVILCVMLVIDFIQGGGPGDDE